MKMKFIFILILAAFLTSSCAKNILVNYQSETLNTSKIVLKYSKVSHKTMVLINDNLIVKRRQAKSVTILNVPAGNYKIRCSSSSGLKKERLEVSMGIKLDGDSKTVVKAINMPIQNGWYWVGVTSMAVWPLVLIAGYTL